MLATDEAPTASLPQSHGAPAPGIQEFWDDPSFVRVLLGGRGSGKTFGVAADITAHLWQNAGGKAIVARETELSQEDSSIDTFLLFFEGLDSAFYRTDGYGFFRSWNNGRTFRVPSQLAIERWQKECAKMTPQQRENWMEEIGDRLCGYIHFRGLPEAEKGKFRGMECSYLALVEADQIAEKQFALAMACLRWKGSDPKTCDEKGFIRDRCVVLDTNPPGTTHWIARMEEREMAKPENERTARFWHLPTEENAHNLPENYIRDTILLPYANNPAMIERMLYGRYADAFDGSAVFYSYHQVGNVGRNLPWIKGAYLIRGWDFGTFNSVVWLMYWLRNQVEYIHAIAEQYLEGSDTDRQAALAVKTTEVEFPFWNDRAVCGGLLDFCDPAGVNSNYGLSVNSKGQKVGSCVEILRTYGIHPGTMLWQRGVQIGVTLINRFIVKTDSMGQRCFKIDANNCPLLHAAFSGGYRYPSEGEPGYGRDEPLKGMHKGQMDYSHLADPVRYVMLNTVKMLKQDYQQTKEPLYRQRATVNLNPERAL